jgi:hypothetical protein
MELARREVSKERPVAERRPARRAPDPTVLDQVVAELKEIDRRTGIERTLAIGELVLKQFFGGDPAAWRDRRRNKNNSIRRLAERQDCPFCRSALNEAIGVYVAVTELPCVRTFGHICASHVASVLGLPSPERQRMLERAEQGRWSVRELRRKVILLRSEEGERTGPLPVGPEILCLPALRLRLKQVDVAIADMEKLGVLGAELRAALRGVALQLAQQRLRVIRLTDVVPDVRSNGRGARAAQTSR